MTQDEIIEMAKQVGLATWHKDLKKWQLEYGVEAFAKLVDAKATAREREACARVCEQEFSKHGWAQACIASSAIRKRGNT